MNKDNLLFVAEVHLFYNLVQSLHSSFKIYLLIIMEVCVIYNSNGHVG